jgi:hypothetical protein
MRRIPWRSVVSIGAAVFAGVLVCAVCAAAKPPARAGFAATALAGEVHAGATNVSGKWSDPMGACVGHIVSFDPATGDITCTGGSTWTGTWKGTTTWTLTGNQNPVTHAVSARIDETFTGRAADGRKGTLAFVERLSIDPTGKTNITGHIIRSCGALAGSQGHARWIGTSAADGSGSGTYSGQWKEGRGVKRCPAKGWH